MTSPSISPSTTTPPSPASHCTVPGFRTRAVTAVLFATVAAIGAGCQMQADFEDGENQADGGSSLSGGGVNPVDPGIGADTDCGSGSNNEILADGTCACLPEFDWCDPQNPTSLECCGGAGQSCDGGTNNELVGPQECACLPGFEWCNMDDQFDLNCCVVADTDDVEPCTSGTNNQVADNGECACLPQFDWCNAQDLNDLNCCPVDGDDTGQDDTTDTGTDAQEFGCEGEMVVTQINITQDTVWAAGSVCVVDSPIVVQPGAKLTILAGVTVKFVADASGSRAPGIEVAGDLVVQGTRAAPVYFTDFADDAVGGDTNGDGGATLPGGQPGTWTGIQFMPGSGGSIVDAELRHAAGDAAILIDRASPSLRGLTFRHLESENISIGATDMLDISEIAAVQTLRGGVSVRGGTINSEVTWGGDVTRTVLGTVRVAKLGTLKIDAGTVIKFPQVAATHTAIGLEIEGSLVALGTHAAPVVFTDQRDDEVGGDSNMDASATTPRAEEGSWAGISIQSTGIADLAFTEVTYAAGEAGVSNRGDTTMQNCLVAANRVGLRGEGPGLLTIRNSSIVNNAQLGALAVGAGANEVIDAIENWWGATSGPGGDAMGLGDVISAGVLYMPFLIDPLD